MKTEDRVKFFKRKTMSMKCLHTEQKTTQHSGFTDKTTKYLSPKNITGLDNDMYNKQQSLIKILQLQVNHLKHQVTQLQQKNTSLHEQNKLLKLQIEQHSEIQRNNRYEQYATVNVLNELKQKIDLLNEDDHLSTFDDIDLQDICRCQQYERQLKQSKDKVRFLQQSLLHSQQIIIKLKDQTKKLKLVHFDKQRIYSHQKHTPKQHHQSKSREKKVRYRISSIEEILQDNED